MLGLPNNIRNKAGRFRKIKLKELLEEIWSSAKEKWNTSNNLWSENVFSTLNRNWNSVDDIWNEI
jgi:hypothetical protein